MVISLSCTVQILWENSEEHSSKMSKVMLSANGQALSSPNDF